MKQMFLFLTLFFSSTVLPMEQAYRYGIEPLATCGAAVLPGASYVRAQVIGDDAKCRKPGPLYRAFSSYGGGLAKRQSTVVLMNAVVGFVGSLECLQGIVSLQRIISLQRAVSYVPSPIDIALDVAKDSDYFEHVVEPLAETPEQVPYVKTIAGFLASACVHRVVLPKIVEYMPSFGQLLERWQQAHAPYSPNILDRSWLKPILYAYCGYGTLLVAEYYCRSLLGKRSKSSS